MACGTAHAGLLRECEPPRPLTLAQRDRLLQFVAAIKAELDATQAPAALIARTGIDLDRWGLRYSHGGVALGAGADTRWAVRQLYYACGEGRPRIYDQGLSAFVFGTDDPRLAYVSVVLPPPAAAAQLARAALDKALVLALLGPRYSADAYAWSVEYQNCNQWLAELLAGAWGTIELDGDARAQAQGWLGAEHYQPTTFRLGWRPLAWAGTMIPWLHTDDHPAADRDALRYRVSMPASIEAFVHGLWPQAQRIEFCHDATQVVVHRGWDAIAPGCRPAPGDRVLPFD
ncbi:MAG: DUF2145 domain-containing protein [Burkholderiales bacterium]|nr:DUF2145 domain-containing protein [Burkholderiales bacterium]MDE1926713.1 DUF2145 domain-containing protein [Burkholderiales bacterium]MDE2158689.1 DUF2145 domain-containing protein [Burkholderiales bacterium]MDE2502267.1 DUF2145 domain-containing protein [Burkholderiales bacterium]